MGGGGRGLWLYPAVRVRRPAATALTSASSPPQMSEEKKQTRLLAEINNGRLAMIGIMGFLAEGKVPGSVPALVGKIPQYAGEVMQPF